ncbi:MAG: hypothetical protein IKA30_04575 [Alphaproteobacteria bacterium]|nr:hypothetical protein [Alphaproteobacteria bacterium]
MKYITKQDALNKGLIKKDGKIYKLSVLEIWFKKGYLDLDKSKYSADERLEYGLRLALDYNIINRANIHSGYIQNSKIDKTNQSQSVSLLNAMSRYNRAIKSVPSEFWPIVRRICIEDIDLFFPENMSERQKTYISYLSRIDLCRGLDRVIASYTKS